MEVQPRNLLRTLVVSGQMREARLIQTEKATPAVGLRFSLPLEEPMQLRIQPEERSPSQLRKNQDALVHLEAFPDKWFPAQIHYSTLGGGSGPGTVDVALDLPQISAELNRHMRVSVEIRYGQSRSALAIPLQALRVASGPCVLILQAGQAVQVPVRLGQYGGGEVEVTAGLHPGDIVLLDPTALEGARYRSKGPALLPSVSEWSSARGGDLLLAHAAGFTSSLWLEGYKVLWVRGSASHRIEGDAPSS
ncbi:MAG: hypothetical protein HY014_03390 [Acidobacteria bacterium]|nr:hypothetical protein [Acidobacteriota bacterium]MBI3487196.1 hypothetical protein [Acidobacteriota bacterium]